MVVIVDYGLGNLNSILNMIRKIGFEAVITSNHGVLYDASKIILPGVGAFDYGMNCIKSLGLVDVLNRKVLTEQTPILGICLGMQLMTKKSEEGIMPGLAWINAETVGFSNNITSSNKLKIPHMGWNNISPQKKSLLLQDMPSDQRYYFVHSYFVDCFNRDDIVATTTYGVEFVSSFGKNNIYGVQFHPEKSHKYGMHLLKNFLELN